MTTALHVHLDPDSRVAEGNGSIVFNDPRDPRVLLKIPRTRTPKKMRRRISAYLRPVKRRFGPYREWFNEYDEYLAAVRKNGALPDCLPELRGFVQTNLGPAFAVEKITDEGSDNMALTVLGYIKAGHNVDALTPALDRFFDDVARNRIVFFDMKLYNICVVRDASGTPVRIVSIDSIGESTLLGLRRWSTFAYNKWFTRSRAGFLQRISDTAG